MKTYQNITIDGEDVGFTKEKNGSRFCNEGKFDNFIKPLLPKNAKGMTFVEFGCNAGLFLKLAKQHGFDKVVGVDKSKSVIKKGIEFRDENKLDYILINKKVDSKFDYDKIPVADVTVMSNFHYYLTIDEFMLFLDKMKFKTRYCIIVTADIDKGYWRAKASLDAIRHYFKEWKEIGTIYPISTEGDTFPRVMSSIIFESPLERVSVEKLFEKIMKRAGISCVVELTKLVAKTDSVDEIDIENTKYYKAVKKAHSGWREKDVLKHIETRTTMLYDVKKNGLKSPLFIRSDNKIVEGHHRFLLLKALGHKNVIVRKI